MGVELVAWDVIGLLVDVGSVIASEDDVSEDWVSSVDVGVIITVVVVAVSEVVDDVVAAVVVSSQLSNLAGSNKYMCMADIIGIKRKGRKCIECNTH